MGNRQGESRLCLSQSLSPMSLPETDRGGTWGRETGEKHGAGRQGRNMGQKDRGETWGRETSEDSSPSPSCSSSQPQLVDNYFAKNSFFLKEAEFAAKSNTPSRD